MDTEQLERAYRYCQWVTARHYENFPVASRLLPRPMRPHVAAVYAFARAADDFADEEKYRGRSLDLLDGWRKTLWASCKPVPGEPVPGTKPFEPVPGTGSHPIFIALAQTVREYHLSVQWLDDLLTAFTMDVTKKRYADWEELMTYCRYSANPIGRLVLALFGIQDSERQRLSDCICTALQLANHWQDLRIDFARDILYIPQDLMRQFGVTEGDLKNLAVRGKPVPGIKPFEPMPGTGLLQEERLRFQALMKDLVHRARALFKEGESLPEMVSGGLRWELRLTVRGGRAILDRIEAAGYDVFRHRPSLNTLDKIGLLTQTSISPSDASLRESVRYCRWLTRGAGSHFSLSFALLSPERRTGMEVVYAYCRAIDDVVDQGDLTEPEARAQLALWRRELRACDGGFPAHPIGRALQFIRRRFDIPPAYLEKLIAGVEMDLHPRRYETFEELKNYCEHVASVVGLISVRIFGCRHPASDRCAQALGLALQLTNILRDLKPDAQRGRIYLPQEDLRRFGCRDSQLLEGRVDGPLRDLIAFEAARAWGCFREAEEACRASGEGRRLLPARIMSAVYQELLRRVERRPEDLFTSRVRVSKGRQARLALRCLLTSSS